MINIKQSGTSQLLQALTQGINAYGQNRQRQLQNDAQRNQFQNSQVESQAKLLEQQRKQQEFNTQQKARSGIGGALRNIEGFNRQTPVALSGPADNLVSKREVPTIGRYADSFGQLINAHPEQAKSIVEALGGSQRQGFANQAVDAAKSEGLSIADTLASLSAGQGLEGRFSTNAQGVTTNELTGNTQLGAPQLHQSIINKNLSNVNQGPSIQEQKTQLEINKLLNEGAQQRSQQAQAKDNALYNSNSILNEVNNIQDKFEGDDHPLIPNFIENNTTGFTGSVLGKVPGTDAYDVRQAVTTLQSNISFDRLQAMREASKTGGALGAISEKELTLLQNSLVALDPNMSQDEFLRAVDKVEFHYERAKQAVQGINPDAQQAGTALQNPAQQNSQQQTQQIVAHNPATGEQIISNDGGQTWQPMQ